MILHCTKEDVQVNLFLFFKALSPHKKKKLAFSHSTDLSGIGTVLPAKSEFKTTSSPSVNSPTMMASEPTIGNVTAPPRVTSLGTTALEAPMLNGTAEVPTLNVVPHTIKLITINMENTTKTPDQAKHPGRMKPYIYI